MPRLTPPKGKRNGKVKSPFETAAEAAVNRQANLLAGAMMRGRTLSEWIGIGQGYFNIRKAAMRQAEANRPRGRAYIKAFGEILLRYPDLAKMADPKTKVATHLMWLYDGGVVEGIGKTRLEILELCREGMAGTPRAALVNSPQMACKLVKEFIKGILGTDDPDMQDRTDKPTTEEDEDEGLAAAYEVLFKFSNLSAEHIEKVVPQVFQADVAGAERFLAACAVGALAARNMLDPPIDAKWQDAPNGPVPLLPHASEESPDA